MWQAPAAKKVVKKATKNAGASKKKVKAVESYKIYIYKVLKQVSSFSTLNEKLSILPEKVLSFFTLGEVVLRHLERPA